MGGVEGPEELLHANNIAHSAATIRQGAMQLPGPTAALL